MNEKELRVPFNAPLNEQDTEKQTYGCRQNNPDIGGKTISCMEKAVSEAQGLSR